MVEMGMGVGRKGGWRRLRLVGVDGKLMECWLLKRGSWM